MNATAPPLIRRHRNNVSTWLVLLAPMAGISLSLLTLLSGINFQAVNSDSETLANIARYILYGVVFAVVALSTSAIGYWVHRGFVQRDRERWATAVFERLANDASPPPSFTLYLRPFVLDDATAYGSYQPPIKGRDFDPEFLEEGTLTVEKLISSAMDDTCPTIMVGAASRRAGPGSIPTTDTRWRDDVALLARNASAIFITPFLRRGTAWELEHLITSNYLRKTFIVIPPLRARGQGISLLQGQARTHQEAVVATKEFFERHGLVLPDAGDEGALVTFDEQLKASAIPLPKKRKLFLAACKDAKQSLFTAMQSPKFASPGPVSTFGGLVLPVFFIAPFVGFEIQQSTRMERDMAQLNDRIGAAALRVQADMESLPRNNQTERLKHALAVVLRRNWNEGCRTFRNDYFLVSPCTDGRFLEAMDQRLGAGVYSEWVEVRPLPNIEQLLDESAPDVSMLPSQLNFENIMPREPLGESD